MTDWPTRTLVALSLVAGILVPAFGWQRISAGADLQVEPRPALESSTTPVVAQSGTPSPDSPVPSETATAAPPTSPPPETPAVAIHRLLAKARVLPTRPQVSGYDRECSPGAGCVFGTPWDDATSAPDSRNGCDTRNDVLKRSLTGVVTRPNTHGCVVTRGTLKDPYTGTTIHFVRGWNTSNAIEIDHLIPLAAAWDLGASTWPAEKRASFANDTRRELLAVSGPANQQKLDSTPASWLPPNKAFRCEYVQRYLDAAVHYDLAITSADVDVIESVALKC